MPAMKDYDRFEEYVPKLARAIHEAVADVMDADERLDVDAANRAEWRRGRETNLIVDTMGDEMDIDQIVIEAFETVVHDNDLDGGDLALIDEARTLVNLIGYATAWPADDETALGIWLVGRPDDETAPADAPSVVDVDAVVHSFTKQTARVSSFGGELLAALENVIEAFAGDAELMEPAIDKARAIVAEAKKETP